MRAGEVFCFPSCFALFSLLASIVYFLYALGCHLGFLFLINIFSSMLTHKNIYIYIFGPSPFETIKKGETGELWNDSVYSLYPRHIYMLLIA